MPFCPSDEQLTALLRDELSPAERNVLAGHVDGPSDHGLVSSVHAVEEPDGDDGSAGHGELLDPAKDVHRRSLPSGLGRRRHHHLGDGLRVLVPVHGDQRSSGVEHRVRALHPGRTERTTVAGGARLLGVQVHVREVPDRVLHR